MRIAIAAALVTGVALGALATSVMHAGCTAEKPSFAGILHGWTVVRDDETLLCVSPALFVAARQIECP